MELTADEKFVLDKFRTYKDNEYADFIVEKRKGKFVRVVASVSWLDNPIKNIT